MLKKITAASLIILIILLSLYLLLGVYFNKSEFADNFLKKTADKTGIKIGYDKILFSLFPRPAVTLEKITISDLITSEKVLTSDKIRISIKILPLMVGKVMPGTIVISSPLFEIERDEEGTFVLPDFLKRMKDKSNHFKNEEKKETTAQPLADSFEIINGSFFYKDNCISPPENFYFSGIDFNVHKRFFSEDCSFAVSFLVKTENSSPAFFEFKGETGAISLNKLSDLSLNTKATIRSLELSPLQKYISGFLPFKSMGETINADIKIKSDSLKNGFTLSGDVNCQNLNFDYKKMFLKPLISKKALINFSMQKTPGRFFVRNFHAEFDRFAVDGAVDFKNISDNESNLYLKFSADDFPYDDYGKNFIPFGIFKPPLRRFMMDKIKGGTVDLRNLAINTVLHRDNNREYPKNPDFLSLDATGQDLSLLFGNMFKPVVVNSGTIKIINGDILFAGAEGKYGNGSWKLSSGELADIYGDGNLLIKAKGEIPTDEITDFLKDGPLPARVREEASKINSSDGQGTLLLTISKRLSDQNSPINYSGSLKIIDADAQHKEYKSEFNIKDASVIFSNKRVELHIKNLTYLGSHILISGVIVPPSSKESELYSSISIDGALSASLLLELLGQSGVESPDINGFVRFRSILEQRDDDIINYTFKSDLTDIGIKYKDLFAKNAPQPSSMTLYLRLSEGSLLIKKGSKIEFETNKFIIDGDYDKKNKYPLSLIISSNNTNLETLSKNIPSLAPLSLEGNSDLKINLFLTDKDNFTADSNIKFKKISSNTGILELVQSASGIVEKNSEHIIFRDFKVKITGSSLNIDGGIDNGKKDNNVVLNIRTDSFDLDKFIQKYPPPKLSASPADKGKNISFDFMMDSGKLTFLENNYENTDADFSYANNRLAIKRLRSSAFEGNLTLDGNIYFSSANGSTFSICSKSEDTDIGRLLNYLGIKGSEISGKVSITDCIDSKWKSSKDIKPNLSGKLSFLSKNGKIRKTSVGVLSKILSFFNLLKWKDFWIKDLETKGMTYNTISADFTGDKGAFHTDNFILDGSSMKISAIGDIDLGENTINMKVAVMPLGTIDTVVSNIPIVGYILTGKDKSLVAAYFEVTGNLNNPDVKTVSMKSLGQGILGIFRRTIGLPYDMMKEIGNSGSGKTTEPKDAPSQ